MIYIRMPSTRKAGCRRNKKQMGGGLGGVLTFAPASHTMNNPLAVASTSSCLAATRPGMIGSYSPHGLPGMSGGKRKGKGKGKRNTKKQRGGAYGFSGADGIVAGTHASYAPVVSIGCTGASPVHIPASGAAGILNARGSELWDAAPGGASPLQSGGSYQLGETMRTAGYGHLTGANPIIPTAAGTNLMVNMPIDGRISGHACGLQKGGRSRKGKKSKNSKKSKKYSKKNRK